MKSADLCCAVTRATRVERLGGRTANAQAVPGVVERCRSLIANPVFETGTVTAIVINATVPVLEAFDSVVAGYHGVFDVLYNTSRSMSSSC